MQYLESFRRLGVDRLTNNQWSVSGWNRDGELVLSLWTHLFVPAEPSGIQYDDDWGRWGNAIHGRKELEAHLREAVRRGSKVRLILAMVKDPVNLKAINEGQSAARLADYHPREDLVGRVDRVDGVGYRVTFSKPHKEQ